MFDPLETEFMLFYKLAEECNIDIYNHISEKFPSRLEIRNCY